MNVFLKKLEKFSSFFKEIQSLKMETLMVFQQYPMIEDMEIPEEEEERETQVSNLMNNYEQ